MVEANFFNGSHSIRAGELLRLELMVVFPGFHEVIQERVICNANFGAHGECFFIHKLGHILMVL